MPSTRRRLLAAGLVTALAGCLGGGDGESSDNDPTPTPDPTATPEPESTAEVTVQVGPVSFSPQLVVIEPETTVVFEHDSGQHTVTFYHEDNGTVQRVPEGVSALDQPVEIGSIDHTFSTAGVYDYFCRPHQSQGMVGSIVVGEPTAGEPGLASVQSSLPGEAPSELEALNAQTREEFGLGGDPTPTPTPEDDDGGDDGDGGDGGGLY